MSETDSSVGPHQAHLHLVSVWNPSYADDAMDRHLGVLLDWAERRDRGEAEEDEVYVWWGKVRSEHREEELPHGEAILALNEQIADEVETHLYLTDHRSLYVGQLVEVTDEPILEAWEGERAHAPTYYQDFEVDFWLMLWDLRRLVHRDTPAVVQELRKLRNTRYHDHPVSLYGGLVELPLLVRRDDDVRWFDDRASLLEGKRWAERDATLRGETERMAAELRDNLLGPEVWHALEPATRTFLASAEAVFRARRDDPQFDFTGPAMEYAKALEVELNALMFRQLRRVLTGQAPEDRTIRVDGKPIDLKNPVPHQSLGSIRHLLEKDGVVRKGLRTALGREGKWLVDEFPGILKPVVRMRNPAAHGSALRGSAVVEKRSQILGIGREGSIARLARTKSDEGKSPRS